MSIAIIHGIVLAFGLILPLGAQNVFVFQQGALQPRLYRVFACGHHSRPLRHTFNHFSCHWGFGCCSHHSDLANSSFYHWIFLFTLYGVVSLEHELCIR